MITVITILYIGCVVLAFKVIKFNVTPFSVAVFAVIGVLVIGGILIGWNLAAPMSGQMVVHRKITNLNVGTQSKERITKMHAKQDQRVKKGDPLWESDPRPNQYIVDQLTAQLAQSNEKISELAAAVEVANAASEKAKAERLYVKAQLDTAEGIKSTNPAAVAALKVTVLEENYKAAEAAVQQALASEAEAQFALASAQEAIKATEAELNTARFNLSQNVVRAPADGYVMNLQAVEGTMTTTVTRSAQAPFMDMTRTLVGAVYPQNLLKNVQPGDTVEIAFRSLPGQIAAGKVVAVLEYTGEGQLEPTPELPIAANLGSKGFLLVRIVLDDPDLAKDLSLGAGGTAAIYTHAGEPFHLISKIGLRIKAWMNYAPI